MIDNEKLPTVPSYNFVVNMKTIEDNLKDTNNILDGINRRMEIVDIIKVIDELENKDGEK